MGIIFINESHAVNSRIYHIIEELTEKASVISPSIMHEMFPFSKDALKDSQ